MVEIKYTHNNPSADVLSHHYVEGVLYDEDSIISIDPDIPDDQLDDIVSSHLAIYIVPVSHIPDKIADTAYHQYQSEYYIRMLDSSLVYNKYIIIKHEQKLNKKSSKKAHTFTPYIVEDISISDLVNMSTNKKLPNILSIGDHYREKYFHSEVKTIERDRYITGSPMSTKIAVADVMTKMSIPQDIIKRVVNVPQSTLYRYMNYHKHPSESHMSRADEKNYSDIIDAGRTLQRYMIERLFARGLCLYIKIPRHTDEYYKIDLRDTTPEDEKITVVDRHTKEQDIELRYQQYINDTEEYKKMMKENKKIRKKLKWLYEASIDEIREKNVKRGRPPKKR